MRKLSSSSPRACSPAAPISRRRMSARRCRRRRDYPGLPGDAAPGAARDRARLAQFFADPRLEALIATALERNRDLAVAVARIDEARGLYRIQRADRLPTLDGSRRRQRASRGSAACRAPERHATAMRSASACPASSSISGAACAICPRRRARISRDRRRPSAPFACR